jgi:hypothetical protein
MTPGALADRLARLGEVEVKCANPRNEIGYQAVCGEEWLEDLHPSEMCEPCRIHRAEIGTKVKDALPEIVAALRLLDDAEHIIDNDYPGADSVLSAKFKADYRALCAEGGGA